MNSNVPTDPNSRPPRPLLGLAIAISAISAIAIAASLLTGRPPAPPPPPVAEVAVPPAPPAQPPFDPSRERKNATDELDRYGEDVEPQVRRSWISQVSELADASFRTSVQARFVRESDPEVRGMQARALGVFGAEEARPVILERLPGAEPELAVWYVEALCRLQHAPSCNRLQILASHKTLAVAFKATLAVADLSESGDARAIRLLEALARREVELREFHAMAGLTILSRLARLGHARARTQLYKLLEHEDVLLRLSAARSLAWVGDETGKDVMLAIFNDGQSAHRVDAALGLVQLGDYAGHALLLDQLDHRDPELRRLAASGLGAIGDLDSARPLIALYGDPDRTVRIAAAAAVLFMLGLDPGVLVPEVASWVQTALRDEDWQVRRSAAEPLRYLPADEAIPLLTAGIVDKDVRVRRRFAEEAAHLGPKAAPVIAEALRFESDPEIQEQSVITLARLANPEVKGTLEEMAKREGRVGILSLGALIAIGETTVFDRLASAYQSAIDRIRMAVVEAAVLAANRIVLPALEKALEDRVAEIRLAAARGLASYGASSARVVGTLEQALGKPPEQAMGAMQALMQLGIEPKAGPSVPEMLDSSDESVRRAVLRAVSAMPWKAARPVLTRAIHHADPEVRRQAVDALAGFADAHRNEVVPMLKPVVQDEDEISRMKSKAQLSRLLPRLPQPPAPAAPAGGSRAPSWNLERIRGALDQVRSERQAFDAQRRTIDGMLEEITAITAQRARHEKDVEDVEQLRIRLRQVQPQLIAAHGRVGVAANAVTAAARDLPDSVPEVPALTAEAVRLGEETMATVADSRSRIEAILAQSDTWLQRNIADCSLYLSAAEAAVATARLVDARRDLLKADQTCARGGAAPAQLHFVWAQYFDERAQEAQNQQKARFLAQARERYDRFVTTGRGFRVERARERSQEITDALAAGADPAR
jgi:HEAT repeat protein